MWPLNLRLNTCYLLAMEHPKVTLQKWAAKWSIFPPKKEEGWDESRGILGNRNASIPTLPPHS